MILFKSILMILFSNHLVYKSSLINDDGAAGELLQYFEFQPNFYIFSPDEGRQVTSPWSV